MISMHRKMISINGIVKKYRLPYSTVNHYTVIGLLSVAARRNNMRLYDEAEVRKRLKRIGELRSKGYPLDLIRKELNK